MDVAKQVSSRQALYASWRREAVVARVEHPTQRQRAHTLGYKAKQGFAVARVRVKKGVSKRPKIRHGRRPKRTGMFYPTDKSKQQMAEEKAARKFRNMEVMNSYWVGDDGVVTWYEIILADRAHPAVLRDQERAWITKQRGRAFRGITSAGRKSRGLHKRGTGSEHTRPSRRQNRL
ncbi:MAG: 50S ribosomal protein L15e [Nanoarchaeota archaeon]|nr:50S ribosomal protein L15e [Nanoarchaeota archaeon]